MSQIEIRTVDVSDEDALRAWWEVGLAASAERPFDAWPSWEVSRQALPTPGADSRQTLLAAVQEGLVVGAAQLVEFLLDNEHLAELTVWVPPAHRRRGIGTLLAAEAEERVRRTGRTAVISVAFAPMDAESPGSSFASACGYLVALEAETKLVDLTTAPAGWAPLEAEVRDALGEHRVVVFEGPCPEEHLAGFAEVLSAFLGEIPRGELDLEQAEWTPERIRQGEQDAVDAGRGEVTALALDPTGAVCGFSDLHVSIADPRHAWIGGTLVMPSARGHRLGLAMKLATHWAVMERFAECERVVTDNAGVNAAMNAVNEAMGYRVVERSLDVQKRL